MSERLFLDLHRLYAEQQGAETWGVGLLAERELLLARDGYGLWLTGPGYVPLTLFGMPVLLDRTLPEGRIELRNKAGRVVRVIGGVGSCSP